MPQTSVLFESSPRAIEVLDEVAHLEPLDIQPSGFQLFRLHL
jgi:hypothetical protein